MFLNGSSANDDAVLAKNLLIILGDASEVQVETVEIDADDEWISEAVAVVYDMNADFERAFTERHPHLTVLYGHFHLAKNLNDNAISEIRRDE